MNGRFQRFLATNGATGMKRVAAVGLPATGPGREQSVRSGATDGE